MIAVKGPQVMVGYLNRPEATAQVIKDGWYSTGDLGYVDPDGFLKITDRLSRFSKIAGEMVPHLAIESAIMEIDRRRRASRRGDRRARPQARRAALRALHRPGNVARPRFTSGSTAGPIAQGLDPVAARLHSRRRDPDHGHRQGRPAQAQADRAGTRRRARRERSPGAEIRLFGEPKSPAAAGLDSL